MKQKVLITGISGMLGKAVYAHFKHNESYAIHGVSRQTGYELDDVVMHHGDLTSETFMESLQSLSFDAVIHCSAEVNVNLCETDKVLAFQSNVKSTENVVKLVNARCYVYVSTDAVFDGQVGDYAETSVVNPLNYYAETKLLGEEAVKTSTDNYYILRTNIYGFNQPMKKSLFEWGYTELQAGNTINGFDNMFFNPMYVGQLAAFMAKLISSDIPYGTYNVAADEKLSKYDFLMKIVETFGFQTTQVNKVYFDPKEFVAPRALNTTLKNDTIKSVMRDFDFSFHSGFSMLKNDLRALK